MDFHESICLLFKHFKIEQQHQLRPSTHGKFYMRKTVQFLLRGKRYHEGKISLKTIEHNEMGMNSNTIFVVFAELEVSQLQ